MLLARRNPRVGAVVLTPSDCLTYFPPPLFRFLVPFSRVPDAGTLLATALRVPHATLVTIPDACTLIPEDQPAELTRHMLNFLHPTA